MEKITVEVTKKHITKGKRKDPCFCPIALALTAIGFKNVLVASNYVFVRDEEPLTATFSEEVRSFLNDFDNKVAINPFTMELIFQSAFSS